MADALHSEALRALDVLDVVPAGHLAVLVRTDAFSPHLTRGELAIVDTTDKARQPGELYVLAMDGSPHPIHSSLRIVELRRGWGGRADPDEIWYAFGLAPDTPIGGGKRGTMVDGPLGAEHWPAKCRGRVVGVMVPA